MESRRGFLGRFFSSGTPEVPPQDPGKIREETGPEEEPHLEAPKKQAIPRRVFLKGTAASITALGGGVVTTSLIRNAAAESAQSEQETKNRKERLENFVKLLEEFSERNAPKTENGTVVPYTSRSLQEQDQFHEKFSKEMSAQTSEMLTEALRHNESNIVFDIYKNLENMDALGVFYQALEDAGIKPWTSGPLKNDQQWRIDRPKVRAKDYLPHGNVIPIADIDPRAGQIDGKIGDRIDGETGDRIEEYYDQLSVRLSIQKEKTWVSEQHGTAFRKTIDDSEVRKILQVTDTTLAEAYSAIKAALIASDFSDNPAEIREAVQTVLESRKQFRARELVGPNTDQFLYFNHPAKSKERSIPTDAVDMLVTYMQKIHPDNPHAVREMKNENKLSNSGTTTQEIAEQSKLEIISALRESRGNVTIFFNTHGDSEYIGISEQARNIVLSAEEIAKALIDRVEVENNPSTLHGTNIILTACYGHNFSEKIGAELVKQWQKRTNQPPDKLVMPTIISAAQTGSVSYPDGLGKTLVNNQDAFKKSGALTGEFLLRRIQPWAYHYEDLTVFNGTHAGDWKEVAETEQKSGAELKQAA